MLIKPEESLLECLVMNADPKNDADYYEFDLKTVVEYRKKMLSAPIKDGKAVLDALTDQRKAEAEDDDMDWKEERLGEMEGGYVNCRFSSYWYDDTEMTYPLWFEQYSAVPGAMSHDELEFNLPAPLAEDRAMDVAVEQYGFCPDVIDQGPEDATVGTLADVLQQSTVWYFWWD